MSLSLTISPVDDCPLARECFNTNTQSLQTGNSRESYVRVGRSVTQCSPIEGPSWAGVSPGMMVSDFCSGSGSGCCSWASLSGALVAFSIFVIMGY